jgi:glycosyltransferase involved in cell wall biosynthesis
MKVLWFITNFNYKEENPYVGHGWINSLLDKIILQDNIEIAIAFFSDKVKTLTIHDGSNYTQFVIPSYVRRMDKVIRNLTFKDNLFADRESIILSVINQYKPEIIHVFGTENPFGLLASKTKIPVVIHIQGILNPCIRKWFPSGFNNLSILRHTHLSKVFKLSGDWAEYIKQKSQAKRELEIFTRTRFFSGRTDWDRRITALLSKSSKYYHCEEILRPTFYLNQWHLPEKRETIRLISIINPNMYKGIETILETAKLLKTHYNHQIYWIVAGVTSNSLLLKMFTHKTKILARSVNVEFIGQVQEVSLVEKMLDSDIFIHTSHIDNSPNSLCEAMMLGMPVISTNVGGIQSLLTDKKEGILVQDGEAFGLAGAILELINNPTRRTTYGQAARQRAIERHDPIKIVDKQIFIYQDILNNHDTKNNGIVHLPLQKK